MATPLDNIPGSSTDAPYPEPEFAPPPQPISADPSLYPALWAPGPDGAPMDEMPSAPEAPRRRLEAELDMSIQEDDSQFFDDIDRPELYPGNYVPPSLMEAAQSMGLSGAVETAAACMRRAELFMSQGKLEKYDVSVEDAATIMFYTEDSGASSPFHAINNALCSRDPVALMATRHIIWKLLTALRKLPKVQARSLYRGMRRPSQYQKDQQVAWHRFTSTSMDISVPLQFMKRAADGTVIGTMFVLPSDSSWGYDISGFSLFPGEAELLMEPERHFVVSAPPSVINGVTMVELALVPSPVLLGNRIMSRDDGKKEGGAFSKDYPIPSLDCKKESLTFSSAVLSWNIVPFGIPEQERPSISYTVELRESYAEQYKTAYVGSSSQCVLTSLLPSTTYSARVFVTTANFFGDFSDPIQFSTAGLPQIPIRINHNATTASSLVIEWDDIVDHEHRTNSHQQIYELAMSPKENADVNDRSYSVVYKDFKPYFSVSGLQEGAAYSFRLRVISICGDIRKEGPFSVCTASTARIPSPFLRITPGTLSISSAEISITYDPSKIPAYLQGCSRTVELQHRIGSSPNWVTVSRSNDSSFLVKDIPPGSCYHYRARLCLDDTMGAFGNTINITPSSIPQAIITFDIVGHGNNKAVISFDNDLSTFLNERDRYRINYELHVTEFMGSRESANVFDNPVMEGNTARLTVKQGFSYAVKGRLLIDDFTGPMSDEVVFEVPVTAATKLRRSAGSIIIELLFDFLPFLAFFIFFIYLGNDLEEEYFQIKTIVFALIITALTLLHPISYLICRCSGTLPPAITGLFYMPFKGTREKVSDPVVPSSTAKILYGVFLALTYVCVNLTMGLFVYNMFLSNAEKSFNWFFVFLPVLIGVTLFFGLGVTCALLGSLKGSHSVGSYYMLFFPVASFACIFLLRLFGPLTCNWNTVYTMFYILIPIHVILFFARIIRNDSYVDEPEGYLPHGVHLFVICIPTFIALPFVAHKVFLQENTFPTRNVFFPVYITTIIGMVGSLIFTFISEERDHVADQLLRVVMEAYQALVPCKDPEIEKD